METVLEGCIGKGASGYWGDGSIPLLREFVTICQRGLQPVGDYRSPSATGNLTHFKNPEVLFPSAAG